MSLAEFRSGGADEEGVAASGAFVAYELEGGILGEDGCEAGPLVYAEEG